MAQYQWWTIWMKISLLVLISHAEPIRAEYIINKFFSVSALIGIFVGLGVLLIAVIIGISVACLQRRRRRRKSMKVDFFNSSDWLHLTEDGHNVEMNRNHEPVYRYDVMGGLHELFGQPPMPPMAFCGPENDLFFDDLSNCDGYDNSEENVEDSEAENNTSNVPFSPVASFTSYDAGSLSCNGLSRESSFAGSKRFGLNFPVAMMRGKSGNAYDEGNVNYDNIHNEGCTFAYDYDNHVYAEADANDLSNGNN